MVKKDKNILDTLEITGVNGSSKQTISNTRNDNISIIVDKMRDKSAININQNYGHKKRLLDILGAIASILSFFQSIAEKEWFLGAVSVLLFLFIFVTFIRKILPAVSIQISDKARFIILTTGIIFLLINLSLITQKEFILQEDPIFVTHNQAEINSGKTNLKFVEWGKAYQDVKKFILGSKKIRSLEVIAYAGMWSYSETGDILIKFQNSNSSCSQSFKISISHRIPMNPNDNYNKLELMKKYIQMKPYKCNEPLTQATISIYPGFSLSIGSIQVSCTYKISTLEWLWKMLR